MKINNAIVFLLLLGASLNAYASSLSHIHRQTIKLESIYNGKRFDGIGAVNGGGATSVLLKDYPARQRAEIMDMVFKPMTGASVSAMLVEIPGDGNSTQGSMPSHSHYEGDFNFRRGYMWNLMVEAKKRNPSLLLDGTAWSMPGWVGTFWSDKAVDYYISWLKGLRNIYGLEMDAIGCHNEKGSDYTFAKNLRKAMNENGFCNVKLHGFDNWGEGKLNFLDDMLTDTTLCHALDVVSAHTFMEVPMTTRQSDVIKKLGKPVWNSEEHIYKKGFDGLISIVKAFNENYIVSGATRIINWYDIAAVYSLEPYSVDPAMIVAHEPWSGHYRVREALWGYAHYGQFTRAGWKYVDSGCRKLKKGGSIVTLHSNSSDDYSIIIETKDAKEQQQLYIRISKELSHNRLCVWRSNEKEQFARLSDKRLEHGYIRIIVDPNTVYSLSTTKGQGKGSFEGIPVSKPFPLPYSDDFEGYGNYTTTGYLPHYTADIIGCFEIVPRPDGRGSCIRQTVGSRTLSWAPEWHRYTIIGDSAWRNYEISSDILLNPDDEAGVMGHICSVGTGYGVWAKGYYLKIDDRGNCSLVITKGKKDKKELIGDAEQQRLIKSKNIIEEGGEQVLAETKIRDFDPAIWHHVSLVFKGDLITGIVDEKEIFTVKSLLYPKGMAGLIAPLEGNHGSTPYFENFTIKPIE